MRFPRSGRAILMPCRNRDQSSPWSARKRTLLAMSPWLRIPPSAMMGLVATAGAPLQGRQLPAAGAKARFQLGDAHLARGLCPPWWRRRPSSPGRSPPRVWPRCRRSRRRREICAFRYAIIFFTLSAWPWAISMVMFSGRDFLVDKLVDGGVVGRFHPQRDRGEQPLLLHVPGELATL